MLSLKTWSISELEDETHKEVGFDVWPIGLQDGVDVMMGLLIVAILQVHGAHYQIKVLIKHGLLDVVFHEEFGFVFHVVLEAELGIVEPLLWVVNFVSWSFLIIVDENIL